MLLKRGIVVSYETIRRWGCKFAPGYATRLRSKKPSRRDVWHLDEAVIPSAAESTGCGARSRPAAKRLLIRLLTKQGLRPKRIITDKLRSHGAAKRQVVPAVERRSHKGLNNRAENPHCRCESEKG